MCFTSTERRKRVGRLMKNHIYREISLFPHWGLNVDNLFASKPFLIGRPEEVLDNGWFNKGYCFSENRMFVNK